MAAGNAAERAVVPDHRLPGLDTQHICRTNPGTFPASSATPAIDFNAAGLGVNAMHNSHPDAPLVASCPRSFADSTRPSAEINTKFLLTRFVVNYFRNISPVYAST
jgi:hypothetical protein